MRKIFSTILAMVFAISMLSGCGQAENDSGESPQTDETGGMNIMYVVSGALGGGNNVDDVMVALDEYVAEYGGSVSTFECKMDTSLYQRTLENAAETGEFDLIVTGFSPMVEPVCNVANMYPDQKFFIFDAAVDFSTNDYPNVISVQVLQNEGAFLAGALAALMTQSEDAAMANPEKAVGFVGAEETTSIVDFLFGYIEGVRYIDSSIEILYSFVGSHIDSALTQELAISQNQSGADVIFAVTNSDLAVADVATNNEFYAICCDTDEAANIADSNEDVANHILTSVVKDYKGMVAPILVAIGEGTAEWGKHTYISYAEGGVYVADNEWFRSMVPESVMEEYQTIVEDMVDGKITVSTAYGASTEEVNEMKALCSAS